MYVKSVGDVVSKISSLKKAINIGKPKEGFEGFTDSEVRDLYELVLELEVEKDVLQGNIRSCPFCGNDFCSVFKEDMLSYVLCNQQDGGCGAAGGFSCDESGAIRKWNKR